MKEISIILKNNVLIPVEEFRILDHYSNVGKFWTLIHRPKLDDSIVIRQRTVEYIFDPEALTIFCIVSHNVLATWDTDCTRYLKSNDEFQLKDSLFIRPYNKYP